MIFFVPMGKEISLQNVILLLGLFLVLFLTGCAPHIKEGLHYKCYNYTKPSACGGLSWSMAIPGGYYYDHDTDTCKPSGGRGCDHLPFSREELCTAFCVHNNPQWSLLSDQELEPYIEFFQHWENEHAVHVLVNGEHIAIAGDFKRHAIQSTCDLPALDLYLDELPRANGIWSGYEKIRKIKLLSQQQFSELFGCLGTLNFDKESYAQQGNTFLQSLVNATGGKIMNGTEFFDLLKNMSEEAMRQRN